MKKQEALRIVNPLMALSFLAVAGVALARLTGLLGNPVVFRAVHRPAGIAFIALAAIHIWLNWGWIASNLAGRRRR